MERVGGRTTWSCCVGVAGVAVVGRGGPEDSCPCLEWRGWSRTCGGTSGMDAIGCVKTADWRGTSAKVVGPREGSVDLEVEHDASAL